MGFVGELNRTEVKERVEQGIRRIVATGKVAGLLTADPAFARHCQELGARLVAVGTDAGLLARSEEHTSELQSLMRSTYAVFCLKKQIHNRPRRSDELTNGALHNWQ